VSAGVVTAQQPVATGAGRIPLRPAEGWLTLFATALMTFVFAGSLVDAGWTPESAGDRSFLLWASLAGLAFGVGGAKIGWGRWRTHLVGALFGGLLLPLIVGGVILKEQVGWDPGGLVERLLATLGVAQRVWTDLVVQGRSTTSVFSHYHLVFGVLVWGAGMLAGYTVFGHRRPLDAVVVLGLGILANMALYRGDQLTLMVLFSAGALLLLIRTHVFEEEVTWARRKIGDPAAVGQLYLRGGAAFIAAAVLGSVLLTMTASSAPLQGLWKDLPRHLQDIARAVQRFAPPGDFRPLGVVGFGRSADTNGVWNPSDATAFQATIPRTFDRQFKWRAGTYAEYTFEGWQWGPEVREPTAARDILMERFTDGDAPTPVGRTAIELRVTRIDFRDRTILGPNMLQWADQPTEAIVTGNEGWFTSVESASDAESYLVSAQVPVFEDIQGGLTEARLRAAGQEYSAELEAIYTALPQGAVGPQLLELLADIRAAVPSNRDPSNPYDIARTMEMYFQNEQNFRYSDDVRELRAAQCTGVSSAECFAIIRQGYCEYYATTMTVLLRELGIPARVVYGFLPGERTDEGVETVMASAAHWWVEVYFGGEISTWVEFDPTGGGVGEPQPIPSGSVGPPTARPSVRPATAPPERSVQPDAGPINPRPPAEGIGPFIAIAVILALGVGALAFASYRRTPNRPMHPDQAWGSLASLAKRFGLGPRPAQTVYEYAGALGDAVPDARVELTTIARAKVEVAYGKRDLGNDRLRSIAVAYHRLRLALIGMVLRRVLRRGRRRPS
jgi:hypothetical protein